MPTPPQTASQSLLEQTQDHEHAGCLFCGRDNPIGFKLDFRVRSSGGVGATFAGGSLFQSYPETLHGGITSALLDAAMTNCLFSRGVAAVTGELTVRFLRPVAADEDAEVVARLDRAAPPLYFVSAQLEQGGEVVARAKAKFVTRSWAAAHAKARAVGR